MLVPISTRIHEERRNTFFVTAEYLGTNPGALLRQVISLYLDSDSAPTSNIFNTVKATHNDVKRVLVLVRHLAESVDPEATEILLERTEAYLKSRDHSGPFGT